MTRQQQQDDVFVLEYDATTTAAERVLSLGQQLHLRNVVASAGFEGHDVDAEERVQLVEIIAGRLSFEDAFAQVMATVPAEAFVHPVRAVTEGHDSPRFDDLADYFWPCSLIGWSTERSTGAWPCSGNGR